MNTERSLLLVDGHHLFHRTYNALPRTIVGRDGEPIQGVYGFAGALLRLTRRFEPSHLCVPFDPPEPPFRRALFAEYRTGRPRGTEEEVANFDAQVGQTLGILDHLGVAHPMVSGYEADDAIGTVTAQAEAQGMRTTIVSGDRDLLQLVSPMVTLFMPKGKDGELWTPSKVVEHWGVLPGQFTNLKALIGDPSDCIPGVRGIGPRTAATLLTAHGSIDGIEAAFASLPARVATALAENWERIRLNLRLVTIVRSLDLPADLDVYRWSAEQAWTATTLLAAVGLRGA